MLELQNITYILPNGSMLLSAANLTLQSRQKIGIVGRNGAGKSSLFRLITGTITPQEGQIICAANEIYIVPQNFGQFDQMTVAQALGVDAKINALRAILAGSASEKHYDVLQDDWTIEEQAAHALIRWKLSPDILDAPMHRLSGGEKTKIFLAGLAIGKPDLILLDEPTNHLDQWAREQLYLEVKRSNSCLAIISHDRMLLNQMERIIDLDAGKLTNYTGNYAHYRAQRDAQAEMLQQQIEQQQKELRKAKLVQRKALERQQRSDARGQQKQERAGVARIMMNTLRNKAEQSTSKTKEVHADKIDRLQSSLKDLRTDRVDNSAIKVVFDPAKVHKGKLLFEAKQLQVRYNDVPLWTEPGIDFRITSGDRVHINGLNGSGKSTLLKLFLGRLEPNGGQVYRAESSILYLDQDYTAINPTESVLEQAQESNLHGLEQHEVKTLLARHLFYEYDWDKPGQVLSGGECMRLLLCKMAIRQEAPDVLVLDEPTNNLDLFSLEILTDAIRDYKGTLIVVSHDASFVDELALTKTLMLSRYGS